ncbi:DMT family transporter [Pigmentibacter ruber]|uniref:DMT family transporter n=1 Tax=Pigmentibacter ruber TaxID=2683196 RepID=UPI00131A947E|nr:DMT family transporter [Pigmentibacter ruber]BFD33316.1 DMT family transporter [Pigmentibacter ruber]
MTYFIFLAILNGVIIGTSRSINGKLSFYVGPLKASLWNHLGGFLFLSFLLYFIDSYKYIYTTTIPLVYLLGGVFGALFVTLNSYVFTKIGAVKTALLVISGQMISSVLLDFNFKNKISIFAQILGIILIITGVYLSKLEKLPFLKQSLKIK